MEAYRRLRQLKVLRRGEVNVIDHVDDVDAMVTLRRSVLLNGTQTG